MSVSNSNINIIRYHWLPLLECQKCCQKPYLTWGHACRVKEGVCDFLCDSALSLVVSVFNCRTSLDVFIFFLYSVLSVSAADGSHFQCTVPSTMSEIDYIVC